MRELIETLMENHMMIFTERDMVNAQAFSLQDLKVRTPEHVVLYDKDWTVQAMCQLIRKGDGPQFDWANNFSELAKAAAGSEGVRLFLTRGGRNTRTFKKSLLGNLRRNYPAVTLTELVCVRTFHPEGGGSFTHEVFKVLEVHI